MTIKIFCYDCQQYNVSNWGVPGFVAKIEKMTFFSEAYHHMVEHPDHCLDFLIESDEEE